MPKFPHYLQPVTSECNAVFKFELINFGQYQNLEK